MLFWVIKVIYFLIPLAAVWWVMNPWGAGGDATDLGGKGGDENKYTLVCYAKRNEGATEPYYDLPSDSVWYSRYFMRMCMLWHTQFNTLINCSQIPLVYYCFKATLWIGHTSNWVDVYFAHTGKFLFIYLFLRKICFFGETVKLERETDGVLREPFDSTHFFVRQSQWPFIFPVRNGMEMNEEQW